MDFNEIVELRHNVMLKEWMAQFEQRRQSIPGWISTFRDGQHCEFVDDHWGSFNHCSRLRFDDGEEWMIRFVVDGKVMRGDDKIIREVAVMFIVQERTDIPIPDVLFWGLSENNPLGLGAFICMRFIRGTTLGGIWQEEEEGSRVLRADISEKDLRTVYNQIAGFYLQLSTLRFPCVASPALDKNNSINNLAPLSLKIQEIEAHGGVRVGGSETFSSATDYFLGVMEQDMKHLQEQPNSVDDFQDACDKFAFRQQLKDLVEVFVDSKHDRSEFRLICDDLRLGNILVNNTVELKIVAVLDWEWAYAAPFQMFYSPPRWLLVRKPIDWTRDDLQRYHHHLRLFLDELRGKEESRGLGAKEESLSKLMQQSMENGQFWFHELMYSCFDGPDNAAWISITELVPKDKFTLIDETQQHEFATAKLEQLMAYEKEWKDIQAQKIRRLAEENALILKFAATNDELQEIAKQRGLL